MIRTGAPLCVILGLAYLGRRTGCCIAASWEGGASTCSDVPAWPSQCGGVRSSLAGTGSHDGRRSWCTASKGQLANEARRPVWSSSSGSRAFRSGSMLMKEGVRGTIDGSKKLALFAGLTLELRHTSCRGFWCRWRRGSKRVGTA